MDEETLKIVWIEEYVQKRSPFGNRRKRYEFQIWHNLYLAEKGAASQNARFHNAKFVICQIEPNASVYPSQCMCAAVIRWIRISELERTM